MKPYYEHAGITIYHGDCREVLPQIPASWFGLILTDPPYSPATHTGARTRKSAENSMDNVLIDFAPMTIEEIKAALGVAAIRLRRWMISFMDWRYMVELESSPPEFMRFIRFGVWVKPNGAPQFTGDRPATGWEAIAIMHKHYPAGDIALAWNGGGARAVWDFPVVHGQHPAEKPLHLCKQLIRQFKDECVAPIVDPFMGSGTTLLAAKSLGYAAIGIEIEEKYCEIAAKRLSQEVLQF